MNKDYLFLTNNEVAVTNESGDINKRTPIGNMHQVLLSENKLERIDIELDELRSTIKDNTLISKIAMKLAIILPSIMVGANLICFFFNPTYALADLVFSVIATSIPTLIAIAASEEAKRGIRGNHAKIKALEELKTSTLEELKHHEFPLYTKKHQEPLIGEIFSLDEESKMFNQKLEGDLEEVYRQETRPIRLLRKK